MSRRNPVHTPTVSAIIFLNVCNPKSIQYAHKNRPFQIVHTRVISKALGEELFGVTTKEQENNAKIIGVSDRPYYLFRLGLFPEVSFSTVCNRIPNWTCTPDWSKLEFFSAFPFCLEVHSSLLSELLHVKAKIMGNRVHRSS